MTKKNNDLDMSTPMTENEVEVYTPETGDALSLRAELGVMPSDAGTTRFVKMYAKCDKNSGIITAGQNNSIVLPCGQSTDCIIIGISERGALKWIEGETLPRKWNTAAEAIADGEILEFPPRGVVGPSPTASYSRRLIMLTKCAGESNPAFQFMAPDGSEYALLDMEFSGTSYRNNFHSQGNSDAGIMTDITWHANHGTPYYQLIHTLSMTKVTAGRFNGYVPKITLRKRMDPKDPIFVAVSEAIRVMS